MAIIKQMIYTIYLYFRFIPISMWIDWNDEKLKKDVLRWKEINRITGSDKYTLALLLARKKEFRNLFIYRNRGRKLYRWWVRMWYKPMDTLFIEAKEIGGGLFIQHGFATMIAAESVGDNCWINQQVTIGFNGQGRPPIIEDNVMITCGAKVLGAITVGKNTVVGANAVVISDVEPGAVVGGIPAKKIK